MKGLLTTLLFFALLTSFGQSEKDTSSLGKFRNLVEQSKLVFIQPDNFVETTIKENHDQYYNYAIKNEKLNVEIR
jgi:hypothetical protein